jgi:predicted membrane GTPase involved in stress response
VLVANSAGTAMAVDLSKTQRLGTLFISEGVEVYPGMIFGESNDSKRFLAPTQFRVSFWPCHRDLYGVGC